MSTSISLPSASDPTRDSEATQSGGRVETRLVRTQAIARIGTWEIDLLTSVMWVSAEAFRIYGLEVAPNHELPLGLAKSIPLPQYRPLLDRALADLVSGAKPYDVEFEICRHNDGAIRHIHSLAEIECDASGRPLIVSGTLHDDTEIVTKTRAMLTALRASEERARIAFEQAADAIFLANADGSFVSVNERALALTGYPREELLAINLQRLFNDRVRKQAPLQFEQVFRGEIVVRERMLTRKDGTQTPVEMHSKRLPDGTMQSIMRDLSERRRLEEQLQLRQRMDSIGTLTSGIAHDFNNILAGIMGYACLLTESSANLDAMQVESVENILHAAQRAADLVNHLRGLARPDRSEAGSFDLFKVASEVVQVLRATTDRLIEKELRVEPGCCLIRGSASNLYHVLMNLGVNAVQAIEQKGVTSADRITVSAERCEVCADHSLDLVPGHYVRVTIVDTGVGMTDEVRQRAFEPLFTTKEKGERKGQGLGLAMVYNIVVRQHGGAVDIETAAGQGCRFHLYLPSAERISSPATGLVPKVAAGREGILVVEDEPLLIALTRTVLESLGYSVLAAADGREAVRLFERERSQIHLVVLDRSLPGLRGEEVFERLMALDRDIPVVVSSGDAFIAPESFPGAYCILQKPYAPAKLGAVVREALDKKRVRSGQASG